MTKRNHENGSFWRSRKRRFAFAFNGIVQFVKQETHAKFHLVAAISSIALGMILEVSLTEWALITLSIGLVFAAEIINAAIERSVDVFLPDRDERAKLIKDMAAGAVLTSALTALVVGLLIFLPNVLQRL